MTLRNKSPRRIWILLATALAIVASAALGSSLLREWQPRQATANQQGDLYPSAKVYRKGSLNGSPVAIREDYLEFPVGYADMSPWESKPPGYYQNKTYADAISDFAVVVHWPSMEPHKPSNHISWLTYRKSVPTEWISIAAVGTLKPEVRPPSMPDNGLARGLKGHMDDVIKHPHKRPGPDGQLTPVELRFELRGLDPDLGLQVAKTVGRDANRSGGGNAALYWRGDLGHIVETAIKCRTGVLPKPASVHKCQHRFEMPELGAYVSVSYTENLLPQWRQIENRAREFVLSLRVAPKNPPIR